MRLLTLSALFLLTSLASSSTSAHEEDDWIFPAEYESHQAMWMLWPTYENKAGFPSTEVVSDLVEALTNHTHVNLAVQDAGDEAAAPAFLMARGVALDHVHFFRSEHMSGLDLQRHLRSGRSAPVPIILTTADPSFRDCARDLGCDALLIKPLPNELLLTTIASFVRRSTDGGGSALEPESFVRRHSTHSARPGCAVAPIAIDNSVGPAPRVFPVFGRKCSQIVPKSGDSKSLESYRPQPDGHRHRGPCLAFARAASPC